MPTPPIAAATPAELPRPLPADKETLAKVLDGKPVLWVGAGLSIGAGYPSTWHLIEAIVAEQQVHTFNASAAKAQTLAATILEAK